MPQIELSQVEPGMVLSNDILGPGDKVLITAGSALSARHIELLKHRDVGVLEVNEPDVNSIQNEEISTEVQEKMGQRFRENDNEHPFIKTLQQAWLRKYNRK